MNNYNLNKITNDEFIFYCGSVYIERLYYKGKFEECKKEFDAIEDKYKYIKYFKEKGIDYKRFM